MKLLNWNHLNEILFFLINLIFRPCFSVTSMYFYQSSFLGQDLHKHCLNWCLPISQQPSHLQVSVSVGGEHSMLVVIGFYAGVTLGWWSPGSWRHLSQRMLVTHLSLCQLTEEHTCLSAEPSFPLGSLTALLFLIWEALVIHSSFTEREWWTLSGLMSDRGLLRQMRTSPSLSLLYP